MTEGGAAEARRQIAAAQQRGFGTASVDQSTHLFAREATGADEPVIHEVAPRTWFGQAPIVNVGFFETDDGVLMVDCGCAGDGPGLVARLREVTDAPLHSVVYTHGHIDHAFGLWAFLDAGERPRVVAHRNVARHFDRYMRTAGYNARINFQQPGSSGKAWPSGPADFVWPDVEYDETLELRLGGERFVLRHAKGETDDHLWAWIPSRKAICTGDLVIWVFPNAGNPQKVQRYPLEWARALREMSALDAELLLPAHGLPISGPARIRRVLDDMAGALESLVEQTLRLMNAGARLGEILHTVKLPKELLEKPYLRPTYDERQVGDDRLSAVQYLRFPCGGEAPTSLGVDHPELELEVELAAETRACLAGDLAE